MERHEARHGVDKREGAQGGERAGSYRGCFNAVYSRTGKNGDNSSTSTLAFPIYLYGPVYLFCSPWSDLIVWFGMYRLISANCSRTASSLVCHRRLAGGETHRPLINCCCCCTTKCVKTTPNAYISVGRCDINCISAVGTWPMVVSPCGC